MISIALTTYNGEKYIQKQIDSILTQTIKDFELIICDDCSSDNTRNILTEYTNKDSRIKIFFNEKNLGFKRNFEEAISHTTGDFVALCDQDDIWASNHLEVLQNLIGDADIANIPTPYMNKVLQWYEQNFKKNILDGKYIKLTDVNFTGVPQRFGIIDKQEVVKFYK